MSTVNLYDVLNVSHDCDRKTIKDAYRKLVKKFHPDKPTGDAEMYDLITHAYNVLIKPQSRSEYDSTYRLNHNSSTDHEQLKSQSELFYKTAKTSDSTVDFDNIFSDMDRKHKYDHQETSAINPTEAKKRLDDILVTREQEDIENVHEELFDNNKFDISVFNAVFDKAKNGTNLCTDVTEHKGSPLAYSTYNGSCAQFDSTELYVDDIGTTDFSSINFGTTKKLSKTDIDSICKTESKVEQSVTDEDYKRIVADRATTVTEFSTDPSCGGYGIFDKIENTDPWMDKRYDNLLKMKR